MAEEAQDYALSNLIVRCNKCIKLVLITCTLFAKIMPICLIVAFTSMSQLATSFFKGRDN